MSSYKVYCDGAYSSATDKGGIAFIVTKEGEIIAEYSKMFQHTTNNRMEQLAAIVALESISSPSEVTIITDSMYVVGTYTQNWKRKKNNDLWERFDKAIARHKCVKFEWVKGHANDLLNTKCDKMAFNASKEL